MSEPGLSWGIKRRFIAYLASLPDGAFSVDEGASRLDGDLFRFPAEPGTGGDVDGARFRGVVRLMGHGGFMHVKIAHPSIEWRGDELLLTIADPFDDDPATRLAFARLVLTGSETGDDLTIWAADAELTAEAIEMFAERYPAGEPLDQLEIRLLTTHHSETRGAVRAPTPTGR